MTFSPLPLPSPASYFLRKKKNLRTSRSLFINALEQESMQIAALDRSILRDRAGILRSIFVVRTCNTNNRQDFYILLSKTLSFIESFNHTLKQTTLTWKKYNKDAIKVMGRFDKNLNVTSTNIPFFPNLACVSSVPKARERGVQRVRSTEGAGGRRKGRVPILPSPSRVVSRA